MFTGIVTALGTVLSEPPSGRDPASSGMDLCIDLGGLEPPPRVGDSVSLSGVCCTVVCRDGGAARFHLSGETLARTWLGRAGPGSRLNLEAALRAGDPLGGHLVQGHVDGVGEVLEAVAPRGGDLVVAVPRELLPYCVEKGSIALDGVSLTLAGIEDDRLRIAVIPHTAQVTTLGLKRPGDPVHVEVDVLAKYLARQVEQYVERMLEGRLRP